MKILALLLSTRHVFVKHRCPRRQQSQNMSKIFKSYILTPPHPRGMGCQWSVRNLKMNLLSLFGYSIFIQTLIISPPPVKPEGTIGLHSVCLSVSLSVSLSVRHTSFRTITDSVIHLWSWNFIHLLPMSQGCALLILGSKGQRSRSWRMVIWKWFPDDNWLCNQPMIMKLHTLTHHESRMRPIDFEVKRSKVKVMAHGYLKMVSGR